MLFGQFNEQKLGERIFHEAPEDNGGGNNPPPEPKTFTQEQVDKIVQERLAKMKRDLGNAEQKSSLLQTQLDELKIEVDKLKVPPAGNPTPPDGELKIVTSRFERQIDEMQKKLDASEKKSQAEENKRKLVERDRELGDALSAVSCKDMRAGRRIMEPQLEFDTVDEKWIFNLTKGGTVSIADGVAEELPDYLKPAAIPGGGGTSGGAPRTLAKQKQLDIEKAKLKELSHIAKSNPVTANTLAATKQRKVVNELELELSK